jgi:DNA mismatch endonuclease (patch repair protein)
MKNENDVHTKEQRSYNMSKIRSKNTKPEICLMKALRKKKIWFTSHRRDVYGNPDIVFKRKKVAVFIDSAFWHGKGNMPKSNKEFWENKLARNIQRDKEVNNYLMAHGWKVVRFSDKEAIKNTEDCVNIILTLIEKKDI